ADAGYLGGKNYNMRLHNPDYNFTRPELAAAVKYAHERGAKIYVTVNNLQGDSELSGVAEYLKFLEQIRPDALIVQDLGVIRLARRMGLSLPLHSSVMMNVHNVPMGKVLKELGVSRVILSREFPLSAVRPFREATGLECEYFIHGDMCIAQSGQCYASGLLFGESSNRGRCLKPCRWVYQLVDEQSGRPVRTAVDGPYLLAIKDMFMLPYIPELIESGIVSFKIEGRMRTAQFLANIVGAYRRAIDDYLADPLGYRPRLEDEELLYNQRARDFSPCYAFKHPGAEGVGYTGVREPRFFSTGCREKTLEEEDLRQNPLVVPEGQPAPTNRPRLSVRVGSLEALRGALRGGADLIYVGGEVSVGRGQVWGEREIRLAVELARGTGARVVALTPRITMERRELAEVEYLYRQAARWGLDGVGAGNLGTLRLARELTPLPVYAEYSLNAFNRLALEVLAEEGAAQATAQPEASFAQLAAWAADPPLPLEAIVHGTQTAMVLEHCLPAALLSRQTKQDLCTRPCRLHRYALMDTHRQLRRIEIDQYCRNHILLANDLCALPYLSSFLRLGLASLRLELQYYPDQWVEPITSLYRQNIDRYWADPKRYRFSISDWEALRALGARRYGLGAYVRGVIKEEPAADSAAGCQSCGGC
ncbi:MAG: U32 family peptidase, partial [Bacillota bacterium]|nr:U32 family peptidase [Bacillota bacterium]